MIGSYPNGHSLSWSCYRDAYYPQIETLVDYLLDQKKVRGFRFVLLELEMHLESPEIVLRKHAEKILLTLWEVTPFSKEELAEWLLKSQLLSELNQYTTKLFANKQVPTPTLTKDPSTQAVKVELPEARVVGDLVGGIWDNLFGSTK